MAVYTKKKREDSEEYLARKKALEDLGAAPVYDPGETGIMATEALQEYLNRPQFSYDVNNDVLYNQYADRYTQAGKLAQQNAMGQAAAMTGGYGNSYAQSVGQQAYQGYMQELTDKIPELQQIAYGQYQDRGQEMLQRYGLLSDEEAKAYGRWQDDYNRWSADRDYLTGRMDAQAAQDRDDYWRETEFDYGLSVDEYNRAQDERQWAWNEEERAYNRAQDALPTSTPDMSDLIDYYKATGDSSVFQGVIPGFDAANISKGVGALDVEDYSAVADYVKGLIETDDDGFVTDTSKAEGYLDYAVKSGQIDENTATQIRSQFGIGGGATTTAEDVDPDMFKGWSPLQFVSYFKGILDDGGSAAANEEIDALVSAGVITKDMGKRYKTILAGK